MKPIQSEGVEAIDTPLYASCSQRILYWNHCTPMALTSLFDQSVWPLALCLEAPTHENPHSKRSRLYGRSQPITVYGQQCILNSLGGLLCNMTALIVSMTEHARTLFTWWREALSSMEMMWRGGDVRVLEHQHKQSVDFKDNNQNDLPCRWFGLEFPNAGRG